MRERELREGDNYSQIAIIMITIASTLNYVIFISTKFTFSMSQEVLH